MVLLLCLYAICGQFLFMFANCFQPQYNGDISTGSMLTLDRNAADNKPDGEEQQHSSSHLDINDADDRMKRYYGEYEQYNLVSC